MASWAVKRWLGTGGKCSVLHTEEVEQVEEAARRLQSCAGDEAGSEEKQTWPDRGEMGGWATFDGLQVGARQQEPGTAREQGWTTLPQPVSWETQGEKGWLGQALEGR